MSVNLDSIGLNPQDVELEFEWEWKDKDFLCCYSNELNTVTKQTMTSSIYK